MHCACTTYLRVSEVNPNDSLGASRSYFSRSRSAIGLPANVGRCVQLGPFGSGKKLGARLGFRELVDGI
jgi:hypothetical protein